VPDRPEVPLRTNGSDNDTRLIDAIVVYPGKRRGDAALPRGDMAGLLHLE